MRIMIFCDLENFKHSVIDRCNTNQYVEVNYNRFHHYLFKKIVEQLDCSIQNPRLIRAYIYTGEYTDGQVDKAKKHLRQLPGLQATLQSSITHLQEKLTTSKDPADKRELEKIILKKKMKIISQDRMDNLSREIDAVPTKKKDHNAIFEQIDRINFLELKTKPLKYGYKDLRFIQKGTDVQLAVDLVSFAYTDNYDVAIICSGDVDLLESIKLIKSLGKTCVLVSHRDSVSPQMVKFSDYYLNMSDIPDADLPEISVVS